MAWLFIRNSCWMTSQPSCPSLLFITIWKCQRSPDWAHSPIKHSLPHFWISVRNRHKAWSNSCHEWNADRMKSCFELWVQMPLQNTTHLAIRNSVWWSRASYSSVLTFKAGTSARSSAVAFRTRGLVSQHSLGESAFHVELISTTWTEDR